jgi:hypothetical protein
VLAAEVSMIGEDAVGPHEYGELYCCVKNVNVNVNVSSATLPTTALPWAAMLVWVHGL